MATLSVTVISLAAVYAVWTVCSWVYYLYFHPLSKFPGATLAAVTPWWRTWHKLVVKDYIPALFEAHAKYGTVVRVAPNELSFSRPETYHELYSPKRRWLKDKNLYGSLVDGISTFNFLDYPSAKKRREVLLSHFSRKSVIELQYLVQERLDVLCSVIARQNAQGQSSDFTHALKCFSLDTITSVCFAKPMNALLSPDFQNPTILAMDELLQTLDSFVQIPILRPIISKVPPSLLIAINQTLEAYNDFRKLLSKKIQEILADPSVLDSAPHPTIYHSLLKFNSKETSAALGFKDLNEEAFVLVFAGTDTASNTISTGSIHCIENRRVYKALKEELRTAWPNLEVKPSFEVLERLPYLTAVVKESLRMSHGIVTPLARVVPPEGATIDGHAIPGGTVVGMSSCFVHWSESVFADARTFKPERWLVPNANDLEPYLVAFSKGPRACVGINLGYCELYMALANIFRRFDMELDGVSTKDLKWIDHYLPLHVGPDMRVVAKPVSS